jgi:hypothetical protein
VKVGIFGLLTLDVEQGKKDCEQYVKDHPLARGGSVEVAYDVAAHNAGGGKVAGVAVHPV